VASSPDYVIAMNRPSLIKYEGQIKSNGILFLNSDLVDVDPGRKDIEVVKIPANTLAKKIGSDRAMNMIMLGALIEKTKITTVKSVMNGLAGAIKKMSAKQMEINRKGLETGAKYVQGGV